MNGGTDSADDISMTLPPLNQATTVASKPKYPNAKLDKSVTPILAQSPPHYERMRIQERGRVGFMTPAARMVDAGESRGGEREKTADVIAEKSVVLRVPSSFYAYKTCDWQSVRIEYSVNTKSTRFPHTNTHTHAHRHNIN